MKVEFVAPFLISAMDIIDRVTGLRAHKGDISVKPSPVMGNGVNVSIGVTGAVTGQVVYCMSLDCGKTLAGLMMDEKMQSLNEMAKSAINELANMITGNATIRLAANGFECIITSPTLFVGSDLTISTSMPILCIPINLSDGNSIMIYVALKESKG